MAQGKRTNIETKAKVVKTKLENIDMSSRDIHRKLKEEGLEVSNDTVCDIINKDLPQLATIDEEMAKLLHGDIEIMRTIQAQKKERLATKEVRDTDMDSWENTAFKRAQLVQGKNTEQVGFEAVEPERAKSLMKLLGK